MLVQSQQKCFRLPYKKKLSVSAQGLKQRLGWGISALHIPNIWKNTQGENVTIAILDGGCDLNHCDLKNNLLPGFNILSPKKDPYDTEGEHCTHVTGIICAENNELGVVGVAPKCKVRVVQVLDKYGDGEIENVVKGIKWAIKQKVDIITMSLGTVEPFAPLRKAIREADKNGIPVFVSGGNMGKSDNLLYPANYPETISVCAIDKNFKRADFNNTGENLDFLAPGVDILSTFPKNNYGILSGSSMAAPFVAGLAALILSYKRSMGISIPLNCAKDYREFFKKATLDIMGEHEQKVKFYQGFGIVTPDKFKEELGLT